MPAKEESGIFTNLCTSTTIITILLQERFDRSV